LRLLAALLPIALVAFPADALAQTRFAVVGDYGNTTAATGVANLIKSNNPGFVLTVGDNCYGSTALSTQIGGKYGEYVNQHHFWPSLGNHEYHDACGGGSARAYFAYFTLPNNERYYDFAVGPVHFFVVNSNTEEPDGITARSKQARWIKRGVASAKEPWKIVYFHHPPYSSGSHGSTTALRWPFEDWGVDAVLSGHDHDYERILRDDNHDGRKLVYIVNGLGGQTPRGFGSTPVSGSAFRYSADNGALFATATSTSLKLEFRALSTGSVVDSYTLTK
jgi:hypothetical protein